MFRSSDWFTVNLEKFTYNTHVRSYQNVLAFFVKLVKKYINLPSSAYTILLYTLILYIATMYVGKITPPALKEYL